MRATAPPCSQRTMFAIVSSILCGAALFGWSGELLAIVRPPVSPPAAVQLPLTHPHIQRSSISREFVSFASHTAHRSMMYSDKAVKTLCTARVGDGSSIVHALDTSPQLQVFVTNSRDPNISIVENMMQARAPRLHPLYSHGVDPVCDVALVDAGTTPVNASVFEGLAASSACNNHVIFRFDASDAPMMKFGGVFVYRPAVWSEAVDADLIKEKYCDIAVSMYAESLVSLDCVGVFLNKCKPVR